MIRSSRMILAALSAFAASACAHMPDIGALNPAASGRATPDLAPRERLRLAIEFLGEGDERRAKAELDAALDEQPGLAAARRLLEQIETDPHALLGPSGREHVVRQGETMSALAERYLGDALLFYALARYNRLDAPNDLSAGQTLMIPRRSNAVATAALAPAPRDGPATAGASTASRGGDPARANQLRLEALRHMNGGQIDRAVTLLRQARALDGANPAIQRDLVRAERLQASLSAPAGGVN
jgi:LysM domain